MKLNDLKCIHSINFSNMQFTTSLFGLPLCAYLKYLHAWEKIGVAHSYDFHIYFCRANLCVGSDTQFINDAPDVQRRQGKKHSTKKIYGSTCVPCREALLSQIPLCPSIHPFH